MNVLEGTRVAVLGSGMAGSTAARNLAEAGCQVTVFEAGSGIGGRMSTRFTPVVVGNNREEGGGDDDDVVPVPPFQFDHGAQYSSAPKTTEFQEAMGEWTKAGVVQDWNGSFASVSKDGILSEQEGPGIKPHYVGYPAMNSICTYLLEHDNIQKILQTRASALFDEEKREWLLKSQENGISVGSFDFLLATDRLSCSVFDDFKDAVPGTDFVDHVKSIESASILALLVAFEEPLGVKFDGVLFEEGSEELGSLGWIAKDSSKPGRSRTDGQECWVVQSGPKAAKRIMSSVVKEEGDSFEDTRQKVNEKAKEILFKDFLQALPKLATATTTAEETTTVPKISYAIGHRWAAAFPITSKTDSNSFVDAQHNFFACGDYLGQYIGRIEGAYLSGLSAATALLKSLDQQSEKL